MFKHVARDWTPSLKMLLGLSAAGLLPLSSVDAQQYRSIGGPATGTVPILQTGSPQFSQPSFAGPNAATGSIVRPTTTPLGGPSMYQDAVAAPQGNPYSMPPSIVEDFNSSSQYSDDSVIYEDATESEGAGSNGLKFGGWAQAGYHSQSTGLFNNVPDRLNAQQVWLYAEKQAAREAYWDFGFRIDTMYGTDASKTQSFGNPAGTFDFRNGLDAGIYGFAIPQAYAELAKDKLSVKVGHFFTAVGYEVVAAPDNFFYSHALTMFNTEPFTHTGVLSSYDANDSTTVYAGWTLGWDTGFAQSEGGSNWLGGFSKSLGDNFTFTYISTAGNFGVRGGGYSHSMVFDMNLTDRLSYIVQSDLLSTDKRGGNNNELGVNQYLIYELTERLAAGTRVEWWKTDRTGTARSTYALTSGVNIKPSENIIIRPETRYNWGPDLVGGADQETPIFGIDVIFTF